MISSVSTYTYGPNLKEFTKEELALFDADGFTRNYLIIKPTELNDKYYEVIQDIVSHQYKLPCKYLQPVRESCSYISQKAQMSGTDKDIKNASVVIEPLNADYVNMIQYTPINQSLPLNTTVTLEVSVPFNRENKTIDGNTISIEPTRKFIWSSNLRTDRDIENKIKSVNSKSIRTKPWMECVHYGSVDIGSEIKYKFNVAEVNTKIVKSFSLFGFRRSDEKKEFVIYVFKCFNLLPIDILKMIAALDDIKDSTKEFINEVVKKYK